MALIVAMAMEQPFVVYPVGTAFVSRLDMIDFHAVSIFEEQFTPTTFPLLSLEQFCFSLVHHRMSFEPLTPIQQVAIIRAGRSFHFSMSLDVGLTVRAEFGSFGCGKHPCSPLYAIVSCKLNVVHPRIWGTRLACHRSSSLRACKFPPDASILDSKRESWTLRSGRSVFSPTNCG